MIVEIFLSTSFVLFGSSFYLVLIEIL